MAARPSANPSAHEETPRELPKAGARARKAGAAAREARAVRTRRRRAAAAAAVAILCRIAGCLRVRRRFPPMRGEGSSRPPLRLGSPHQLSRQPPELRPLGRGVGVAPPRPSPGHSLGVPPPQRGEGLAPALPSPFRRRAQKASRSERAQKASRLEPAKAATEHPTHGWRWSLSWTSSPWRPAQGRPSMASRAAPVSPPREGARRP